MHNQSIRVPLNSVKPLCSIGRYLWWDHCLFSSVTLSWTSLYSFLNQLSHECIEKVKEGKSYPNPCHSFPMTFFSLKDHPNCETEELLEMEKVSFLAFMKVMWVINESWSLALWMKVGTGPVHTLSAKVLSAFCLRDHVFRECVHEFLILLDSFLD